jgi:hypothetical protein
MRSLVVNKVSGSGLGVRQQGPGCQRVIENRALLQSISLIFLTHRKAASIQEFNSTSESSYSLIKVHVRLLLNLTYSL